jgi:hypothetical protein
MSDPQTRSSPGAPQREDRNPGAAADASGPDALARFDRFSVGAMFAFCVAPTLIGVALAVALHLRVVIPSLGVGSNGLTRMVRLGEHLAAIKDTASSASKPRVCVLGDSVSVEGIDAAAIARGAADSWQVENYAINGATREQIRIVLPKVLATKPEAVVYVLRAQAITDPPKLPVDLAYAYALGGFPAAWPKDWITPAVPGLTPAAMEGLEAGQLEAQLHFRGALVYRFNDLMHERFSGKTKLPPPDEWGDAHHMTGSIVGERLDRHVKVMEEEVAATARMSDPSFPATLEANERDLAELSALIRASGATPVFVIAPVHPALRAAKPYAEVGARLDARVAEMQARDGVVRIDARTLLDADDFADAQHPGPSGRVKLSEFIGRNLPAAVAD